MHRVRYEKVRSFTKAPTNDETFFGSILVLNRKTIFGLTNHLTVLFGYVAIALTHTAD
jgi:hypothetical protein